MKKGMRVRAFGRHLLVKMDGMQETTKGGIVIPDAARRKEERAVMTATVLDVGFACFDDMPDIGRPEIGDRIVVDRYAGKAFYSAAWDDTGESPYRIILDTEVRGIEDSKGAQIDV